MLVSLPELIRSAGYAVLVSSRARRSAGSEGGLIIDGGQFKAYLGIVYPGGSPALRSAEPLAGSQNSPDLNASQRLSSGPSASAPSAGRFLRSASTAARVERLLLTGDR